MRKRYLKRGVVMLLPAAMLCGCQYFQNLPSASYSEDLDPSACAGIFDNYEQLVCQRKQQELRDEWQRNRKAEREERREEAEAEEAKASD